MRVSGQVANGIVGLLLTAFFCQWHATARAADWPAWRFDAGRTAASPADLPDSLHLNWVVKYSPRKTVWDDPLNQDLMRYDRVFEPIVVGQTMLLGFNDTDKLVALDTETGQEKWRYYTSGPVRMPPAVEQGRVYLVSDDGWLYCLRIDDGTLLWNYRGGPADRKLIGNERLISSWPARGAPAVRDGTVYFAASIWPLMGTFIYALDAETGELQWINDATSAQYIDQPHDYPAFAGIAPQGILAATEDELLVPGGRSVPACFDRRTGEFRYYHLAEYGKYGGSWVFANDNAFFAHIRDGEYLMYDLASGKGTKTHAVQPVLTEDAFYSSGESVAKFTWKKPNSAAWQVPVDATGDLIKAGGRLYAGGKGSIAAIEQSPSGKPRIAWESIADGNIERLVAADDKLFAVTLDGRIMAFGAKKPAGDVRTVETDAEPLISDQATDKKAISILQTAGTREGYALFYGIGDGKLLEALVSNSSLHIVAIEPNQENVGHWRRKWDAAGLYGNRIAVIHGDIDSVDAPPYMSNLTIVHDVDAVGFDTSTEMLSKVFESLRPYGGVAILAGENEEEIAKLANRAGMEQAEVSAFEGQATLTRQGPLPGAGEWTHQYGNSANTVKSDDALVKLPLGVLWFGGSSNLDVLPRHGHGPPEQIIGGRLFIEGMDCLSARDVYTGRVLWKVTLENLDNFGVFYDETYKDLPLTLEYNQVHIPGANARGTNFVATLDRVYIIEQEHCRVLDAATGETLNLFTVPSSSNQEETGRWGYLAVNGDLLIAGAEFADFSRTLGIGHEKDPDDSKSKWRFTDYDKAASSEIVVMDRFTGEEKWRVSAEHGFLHNAVAISDGKLFCIDKLPLNVEKRLARRGRTSSEIYRLFAIDLESGETLWQTDSEVFGSWLSYSKEHDLLLQSTRPSNDTVRDENGLRMIVYHADTGAVVWDKPITYNTPPILHGDDIITGGKRFSLLTGEPRYRIDPLTGKLKEWTYESTKGCNYPIAAENLLTFRSSAAAFFDLAADGGTGHFGGFKSGCTSNLIAADGVLNAPEYTRTCRCSFQNQTSLALVHMPDLEIWTHNDISYEDDRVVRAGINFGAPGDRRSTIGTLWLEYPSVGGPSPEIAVEVDGEAQYFRNHASRLASDGMPWVAASGVEGAKQITIHLEGGSAEEAFDGTRRAAQSGDDAEEPPHGEIDLDSSDLELTNDDGELQTVGIRFGGLRIPPGSKIKSAAIQFTADEPSHEPTKLHIIGVANDNAREFTSRPRDVSRRPKTKGSVVWEPGPWPAEGESGSAHRTPDLSAILQEIVDRNGWQPGNAAAFVVTGTGLRIAKSFDGGGDEAPTLHVDFEPSGVQVATAEKPAKIPTRGYTVRLHFAEPDLDAQPGERVFGVAIQGEPVVAELDVVAEAGGPLRGIVKEFAGVQVADELTIALTPHTSRGGVLCGVEVVAE